MQHELESPEFAANALVLEHGIDAILIAAFNAQKAIAGRDVAACKYWRSVMLLVEESHPSAQVSNSQLQ